MIVEDVVINITRKKMKHLRVVVSPGMGQVRVSAPIRMSEKSIHDFVVSKLPWIKKHLASEVPQPHMPIDVSQRQKLYEDIAQLVEKYEKIMGVSVAEFRIKHMKTRWGTCNTRARRIWINAELARKSSHCLEYIVVHEMVHLFERRHNARFKSLMDTFLPSWRQYQHALNKGVMGQDGVKNFSE